MMQDDYWHDLNEGEFPIPGSCDPCKENGNLYDARCSKCNQRAKEDMRQMRERGAKLNG